MQLNCWKFRHGTLLDCVFLLSSFQAAVLSGVKGLADFVNDPSQHCISEVLTTQLSFLSNENEIKAHLRKSRANIDGSPSELIPRLQRLINPVFDFIQVV